MNFHFLGEQSTFRQIHRSIKATFLKLRNCHYPRRRYRLSSTAIGKPWRELRCTTRYLSSASYGVYWKRISLSFHACTKPMYVVLQSVITKSSLRGEKSIFPVNYTFTPKTTVNSETTFSATSLTLTTICLPTMEDHWNRTVSCDHTCRGSFSWYIVWQHNLKPASIKPERIPQLTYSHQVSTLSMSARVCILIYNRANWGSTCKLANRHCIRRHLLRKMPTSTISYQ
jgi:hypothetical protein